MVDTILCGFIVLEHSEQKGWLTHIGKGVSCATLVYSFATSFHLDRVHDIYDDENVNSVFLSLLLWTFIFRWHRTIQSWKRFAGIARIMESKRLNETIWMGSMFSFGMCVCVAKAIENKIWQNYCHLMPIFSFVACSLFFVCFNWKFQIHLFSVTCFMTGLVR